MIQNCSFQCIDIVLSTWEIARQQQSSEEELGMEFLLNLFAIDPETKQRFGFRPGDEISKNPLLRMGLLVHAARVIETFNDVISMIGPDLDDLEQLLIDMANTSVKTGVDTPVFDTAAIAARQTLSKCFGSKWNTKFDEAWIEFLQNLSAAIIQQMKDQ
jgi:Globin